MKPNQKLIATEWNGKQGTAASFTSQLFEDFTFRECQFNDCKWLRCKFYRTSFQKSRFINCTFEQCKFYGEHSYLGPATFEKCTFLNCDIKNVQLWMAEFKGTNFPDTRFNNINFYGSPDHWRIILQNVDFTEAHFGMTGFYGVDLSSVKMPSGVRVFRNTNNEFRRAYSMPLVRTHRLKTLRSGLKNVIEDHC